MKWCDSHHYININSVLLITCRSNSPMTSQRKHHPRRPWPNRRRNTPLITVPTHIAWTGNIATGDGSSRNHSRPRLITIHWFTTTATVIIIIIQRISHGWISPQFHPRRLHCKSSASQRVRHRPSQLVRSASRLASTTRGRSPPSWDSWTRPTRIIVRVVVVVVQVPRRCCRTNCRWPCLDRI